jgi:para-aminobenzoate synthetase component 1
VASISPERFLRWWPDGRVETRPIKGTRPRGASPEADAALIAELQSSEKDLAEHVMIVDLERNDLGRVCEPGSVRVSRAWALETHPTVHHLVSVVEGRLEAQTRLSALLEATFPGGSITGAPKLAAVGIIDALEPSRRGLYCGAIGYLDAAGGGDLNIAIRTAWTDSSTAYYQAGGGIVWDSDAAEEWAETLTKARAFVDACAALTGPA